MVDFDSDPRLLAGARTAKKRLVAQRFRLDESVFPELRALCEPVLEFSSRAEARPYEQFAALEPGEQYFAYDISDLPTHPPTRGTPAGEPGSTVDDTADLVRLVRTVDALDEITRTQMEGGGHTFYSICWPHGDTMLGFVTKISPFSVLRPGWRYLKYEGTLRAAERPDVALEERCDLVVAVDRIAVLRPAAFGTLLGDVQLLVERVPQVVRSLRSRLAKKIPLSAGAAAALVQEGQRLPSCARRLHALGDRLTGLSDLDATSLRRIMRKNGDDPKHLLDQAGAFTFGKADVGFFLDVLESGYFQDDFSSERRRADRWSTR